MQKKHSAQFSAHSSSATNKEIIDTHDQLVKLAAALSNFLLLFVYRLMSNSLHPILVMSIVNRVQQLTEVQASVAWFLQNESIVIQQASGAVFKQHAKQALFGKTVFAFVKELVEIFKNTSTPEEQIQYDMRLSVIERAVNQVQFIVAQQWKSRMGYQATQMGNLMCSRYQRLTAAVLLIDPENNVTNVVAQLVQLDGVSETHKRALSEALESNGIKQDASFLSLTALQRKELVTALAISDFTIQSSGSQTVENIATRSYIPS